MDVYLCSPYVRALMAWTGITLPFRKLLWFFFLALLIKRYADYFYQDFSFETEWTAEFECRGFYV
jgi:hypothetical protein